MDNYIYIIYNTMDPIKEDVTPDSSAQLEQSGEAPRATSAIADISDQTSGEPISEVSTDSEISESAPPVEPYVDPAADIAPPEGAVSPVAEIPQSVPVENPPFLQSEPTTLFTATNKLSDYLKKAINFRKTIKHKKRAEYEKLSDHDKAVAKKQIVDNLIHILRESTNKSTFKSHKKSIVKLRHTFNKHLDYIETKKRTKTTKKGKPAIAKSKGRSKSRR